MQAEDWVYVGEGGAHVVFSYRPVRRGVGKKEKGDDGSWFLQEGTLLRLVKQNIAKCSLNKTETLDQNAEKESCRLVLESSCANGETTAEELWYMVHIVVPSIHRAFVDVPLLVELNKSLAKGLYQRALDSGQIPSHRQESWRVDEKTVKPTRVMRGMLLRDYRLLSPTQIKYKDQTQALLSVEIKPKAAYTAISPLVDPNRRIKYQKCRYQMLHGHVTKYDPMDLFSQNASRIRHSIQALVDEPRNNFRLWLAQNSVLQQGPSIDLMHHWMAGSTQATLIDLVTAVLQCEDAFLQRVNSLQRLDLIDSDGAVRIYDHLGHRWLGGLFEEAHELLDAPRAISEKGEVSLIQHYHDLLSCCPLALMSDLEPPSTALRDYLADVMAMRKYLSCHPYEESMIETVHQNATSLVKHLSRDDCVALLRLWLLSLAACDLSFFVCLWVMEPTREAPAVMEEGEFRSITLQSTQKTGALFYGFRGQVIRIGYEIKVIDCDQKPAKKLKCRRGKEDDVFQNMSTAGRS